MVSDHDVVVSVRWNESGLVVCHVSTYVPGMLTDRLRKTADQIML